MLQLYDLAGIYYRAFHALPTSLVGPHGRPVNAIRGSLDILARVIADARPDRAVACLDVDWRPAWRVALMPSYKAHRVAESAMTVPTPVPPPAAPAGSEAADERVTDGAGGIFGAGLPAVAVDADEAFRWQIPVLLEVLHAIGITLAGAAGCEADDVIATIVGGERDTPVEIVSGDKDLYQLVRTDPTPVAVRYIGAGLAKAAVIDAAALAARYGMDGPGYAAMATMRGDPSDGLPGVAGIGEKTAARLIARYGDVAGVIAAARDADSALTARVRAAVLDAQDYLAAAVVVVRASFQAPVDYLGGPDSLPRAPRSPTELGVLTREHGLDRSVERLLGALTDR